MSRAYYLATLLLLSSFPAALAQAQSDSGRPRRTQAPATVDETGDRQPTAAEASAEAKKLYNSGVKYGRAGLFKQAAESFEQAVKLNPDYADITLSRIEAEWRVKRKPKQVDHGPLFAGSAA